MTTFLLIWAIAATILWLVACGVYEQAKRECAKWKREDQNSCEKRDGWMDRALKAELECDAQKRRADLLEDYNKRADIRIQALRGRASAANSHLRDLITLASRSLPPAEPKEAGGDTDD